MTKKELFKNFIDARDSKKTCPAIEVFLAGYDVRDNETCEWTKAVGLYGYYTSCGSDIDGPLYFVDQEGDYCPHCGKKVVIV